MKLASRSVYTMKLDELASSCKRCMRMGIRVLGTVGDGYKMSATVQLSNVCGVLLFQYTYTPTAQLVSLDSHSDANTHTQV